ncbi:hypothetical protein LY76DRAFT_597234 [Colletotrichum caudatum]|nr:hypothetical protein LY76DRAFT_597234 [Colletotrichum caudatum]
MLACSLFAPLPSLLLLPLSPVAVRPDLLLFLFGAVGLETAIPCEGRRAPPRPASPRLSLQVQVQEPLTTLLFVHCVGYLCRAGSTHRTV